MIDSTHQPWAIDNSIDMMASTEESDLRDAIRAMVTAHGDIEDVRSIADSDIGYSSDLWSELVDSIAVTTIAVPESAGGLGYGLTLLCAVIEECARALRPEPIHASAVVGVPALLLSNDDRVLPLRARALAGSIAVATTSLTPATDRLLAHGNDGAWTVTGHAVHIAGGPNAGVVIVSAGTGSGRRLFAVPTDTSAATLRPHESIDPTRKLCSLRCEGASAIPLTSAAETSRENAMLRTRAIIALAAENVGISSKLLEMTCEYAQSRQQFGRTIASFQVIKHRLADMLLDVERARSAARYAAALFDAAPEQAGLAAAVAGAVCGDAAIRVATETIQLHGGIGFTWEHPAHNYYRRVLTNETLYGGPTEHRRRIAECVVSPPTEAA